MASLSLSYRIFNGAEGSMGWIFRDGDTRAAKVIQLVLALPLGMALVGLYARSNLVSYGLLRPWAIVAGCVVALGLLVALFKDKNPVSAFVGYGMVKRLLVLALVIPFAWWMGFFSVWLGVPTVWANLVLESKLASVTVTQVWRERSGRGCHHRIEIQGGPLPQTMTPCVSKELREAVRRGTVVEVEYTDGGGAFFVHDVTFSP